MDPGGRTSALHFHPSSSTVSGRGSGRIPQTRPSRRKLTEEQELCVQRHVRNMVKAGAEGYSALWDGSTVHQLVHELTGVELPERTFRTYLARWDLVPQRPVQLAYKMAPSAVKRWMSVDHPVISAQARADGAELLWFDVYRMRTLVGPESEQGTADHLLFLSDNRGNTEWVVGEGYPSPERICWFLDQAVGINGRRLHLLVREKQLIDGPLLEHWSNAHKDRLLLIPFHFGAK